eukprot:tig00021464_g21715.t1
MSAPEEEEEEAPRSIIKGLISQLRVGMDLTKVQLPVFVLEPRSFLEKLTDFFSHSKLLLSIPDASTPLDRMLAVARWYVSGFHIRVKGVKKPYNPLLGEIFRCKIESADGHITNYIAEQTSHHPPISSFYLENTAKKLSVGGSIRPRSKFLGNSAASIMEGEGVMTLHGHSGEEYVIQWPNYFVRHIIVGSMFMETGGSTEIRCKQTGYRFEFEFKTKGAFNSNDLNRVIGSLKKGKEILYTLEGYWDNQISLTNCRTKAQELFFDANAEPRDKLHLPVEEEQGEYEARKLWRKVTAALKAKDMDKAQVEKNILDEKQRSRRKELEDKRQEWVPELFRLPQDGMIWQYIPEKGEKMKIFEWSGGPNARWQSATGNDPDLFKLPTKDGKDGGGTETIYDTTHIGPDPSFRRTLSKAVSGDKLSSGKVPMLMLPGEPEPVKPGKDIGHLWEAGDLAEPTVVPRPSPDSPRQINRGKSQPIGMRAAHCSSRSKLPAHGRAGLPDSIGIGLVLESAEDRELFGDLSMLLIGVIMREKMIFELTQIEEELGSRISRRSSGSVHGSTDALTASSQSSRPSGQGRALSLLPGAAPLSTRSLGDRPLGGSLGRETGREVAQELARREAARDIARLSVKQEDLSDNVLQLRQEQTQDLNEILSLWARMRKEKDRTQAALDRVLANNAASAERVRQAIMQIRALQQEKADARHMLEATLASVDSIRKEMERTRSVHASEAGDLRALVEELRRELQRKTDAARDAAVLRESWRQWRESLRAKRSLRRVVARWRDAGLRVYFAHWQRNARLERGEREEEERAAALALERERARALQAERDQAASGAEELRARLEGILGEKEAGMQSLRERVLEERRKAAAKLLQSSLSRWLGKGKSAAWNAWRQYVAEQRSRRAVLRRFTRLWQQRWLRASWRHWREFVDDARKEKDEQRREAELAELRASAVKQAAALEAAAKERAGLEKRLEAERAERASLERELAASKARGLEVEQEAGEQQRRGATQAKQLAEAARAHEALQRELEAARAQAEKDRAALQHALDAAREQAEEERASLEKALGAAQRRAQEAELECSVQAAQLAEAARQFAASQRELEASRGAAAAGSADAQRLTARVAELEAELGAAAAQKERAVASVGRTRALSGAWRAWRDYVAREREAHQGEEAARVLGDLEEARRALEEARAALAGADETKRGLESASVDLTGKLQAALDRHRSDREGAQRRLLLSVFQRWARRDLAAAFLPWRQYAAEKRARRKASARAAERLRLRSMTDAFGVWRREAHLQSQLRAVDARGRLEADAEQLRRQLSVAQGRVAELEQALAAVQELTESSRTAMESERAAVEEERLRVKERVMRRVVERWSRASLRGCFMGWREAIAEARRKQELLRRVVARLQHRSVYAAFAEWREAARERRHQRGAADVAASVAAMQSDLLASQSALRESQAARAALEAELTRLGADVVSFRDKYERAREDNRTRVLGRVIMRMQKREAAVAFGTWREFAADRARKRSIVTRLVARMRHRTAFLAFDAWKQELAASKAARGERTLQEELAGAQESSAKLQAALRESEAARAALEAELTRLGADATLFREKFEKAREEGRTRILTRVILKMQKRDLSSAFGTWREYAADSARKRKIVTRFVARIRNRAVLMTFDAWKQELAVSKAARGERSLQQQLADAQEASSKAQAALREAEAARAALEAELTRLGADASAFREKFDREREASRTKILNRVILKMQKRDLSSAFGTWREYASESAQKRRIVTRFVARIRNRAVLMTFDAWKQELAVSKAARGERSLQQQLADAQEASGKAQAALREAEAARAALEAELTRLGADANLFREKFEKAREEGRTKILTRVILKMQKRDLSSAFGTWREYAADSARKRKIVTRFVARIRNRAVLMTFDAWKQELAAQKATRGELSLQQRLAAAQGEIEDLRQRLALGEKEEEERRATLARRALVDAERRRRKLENVIGKWQRQELSRPWCAWREHVLQARQMRTAMRKVVARMQNRTLELAFFEWAGAFKAARAERREAELAAAREALAAQERALETARLSGDGLSSELQLASSELADLKRRQEAEREAARARVMTAVVRRMRGFTVAGAWSAWREFVAERRRQRAVARRVVARLQQRSLAVAFAGWREEVEEQRAAREKGGLAASLEEAGRRLQEAEGRASGLEEEKARLEGELLRLRAGLETVSGSRDLARAAALRTILLRWQRRDLWTAMRAWTQYTASAARTRVAARRAVAMLQNRALATAFSGWSQALREAKEERREADLRAARDRIAALESKAGELETATSELADLKRRQEAEREAARARVMTAVVRRMRGFTVAGAWSAWREFVAERRRQRALLRRVAGRLQNAKLASAWSKWRQFVDEAVDERRQATAAAEAAELRQRSGELERALHTARDELAVAKAEMQRQGLSLDSALQRAAAEREAARGRLLRAVVQRWQRRDLALPFQAWREWAESQRRAKSVLTRAVGRWRFGALSMAFSGWAAALKQAKVERLAQLNAAVAAELQATRERLEEQARAARSSGSRVDELAVELQAAAARLEAAQAARQEACLQRMAAVLKRWTRRSTATMFGAWRAWAAEEARRRRLMKQVAARLVHRGAALALAAWREELRSRKHERDVVAVRSALGDAQASARELAAELERERYRAAVAEEQLARLSASSEAARARLDAEREERKRRVMLAIVQRWGRRETSTIFAAWRKWAADEARLRRVQRSVVARLRGSLAATAFNSWLAALAQARREREAAALAAAERAQAAAEAAAQEAERARGRVAEQEAARGREQAALQLERQRLEEQRQEERERAKAFVVGRLLARWSKQRVLAAWNAWRVMAAEGARRRALQRSVVQRLRRRLESVAFAAWWQELQERKAAREREASESARRALEQQLAETAARLEREQRERAALMGAATAAGSALEAFEQRRLAEQERHRERVLASVLRRWQRREVAPAFAAWVEFARESARRRRLLDRVARAWKARRLAGAWRSWVDFAVGSREEARRRESTLTAIVLEVARKLAADRAADAEALASRRAALESHLSADRARLQRLLARGVLGRLLCRPARRVAADCFGNWREYAQERAARRTQLRSARARIGRWRAAALLAEWRRTSARKRVEAAEARVATLEGALQQTRERFTEQSAAVTSLDATREQLLAHLRALEEQREAAAQRASLDLKRGREALLRAAAARFDSRLATQVLTAWRGWSHRNRLLKRLGDVARVRNDRAAVERVWAEWRGSARAKREGRAQIEAARADLKSVHAELEKARKALDVASAESTEYKRQLTETLVVLRRTEAAVAETGGEGERARRDQAALHQQLKEARAALEDSTRQSEAYRREANSFRAQLAQAMVQVEQGRSAAQERRVASDEVAQLRAQAEAAVAEKREAERHADQMRDELARYMAEMERSRRDLQESLTRSESYRRLLASSLEQLNTARMSTHQLDGFRALLTSYVDELERSISSASAGALGPVPGGASGAHAPAAGSSGAGGRTSTARAAAAALMQQIGGPASRQEAEEEMGRFRPPTVAFSGTAAASAAATQPPLSYRSTASREPAPQGPQQVIIRARETARALDSMGPVMVDLSLPQDPPTQPPRGLTSSVRRAINH